MSEMDEEGTSMDLFNRAGEPRQPSYTNEKGVPFHTYTAKCRRCGGLGGGEQWRYTGWTCYECNGTGHGTQATERLYTAEKLVALNATAAKRFAKKTTVAQDKAVAQAAEAAACVTHLKQ
jgi:hypothetical protein